MSNDVQQQVEEIEALQAIYGDLWVAESEKNFYSMQINKDVKIFIKFGEKYPSLEKPKYELFAPTLTSVQKAKIFYELNRICIDHCGNVVLFEWIEKLKELCEQFQNEQSRIEPHQNLTEENKNINTEQFTLKVTHSTVIQDRKSVFQGHCCKVISLQEVRAFMEYLLKNKKIAQATHNIFAYRILKEDGVLLQDYDDDGENHAGRRILNLLQTLNLHNVIVVVSRWYGGIHLGPDRFKHINNAVRQALIQGHIIF